MIFSVSEIHFYVIILIFSDYYNDKDSEDIFSVNLSVLQMMLFTLSTLVLVCFFCYYFINFCINVVSSFFSVEKYKHKI